MAQGTAGVALSRHQRGVHGVVLEPVVYASHGAGHRQAWLFLDARGGAQGWSLSAASMRAMAQGTAGVALSRRQRGGAQGWSLSAASMRAKPQEGREKRSF